MSQTIRAIAPPSLDDARRAAPMRRPRPAAPSAGLNTPRPATLGAAHPAEADGPRPPQRGGSPRRRQRVEGLEGFRVGPYLTFGREPFGRAMGPFAGAATRPESSRGGYIVASGGRPAPRRHDFSVRRVSSRRWSGWPRPRMIRPDRRRRSRGGAAAPDVLARGGPRAGGAPALAFEEEHNRRYLGSPAAADERLGGTLGASPTGPTAQPRTRPSG